MVATIRVHHSIDKAVLVRLEMLEAPIALKRQLKDLVAGLFCCVVYALEECASG
jgi:hypothetical protein